MNKNITVGMLFAKLEEFINDEFLKEFIRRSNIEHEKIVSINFDAKAGELVIETEVAVYPIAISE